MVTLNIGAGKILPLSWPEVEGNDYYKRFYKDDYIVNLDKSYFNAMNPEEIESIHKSIQFNQYLKTKMTSSSFLYCNCDIYDFLERYKYKFDKIVMYRFLEHVPKTKVLYFIYLLSTCINTGGYIDIIVPNYKILAERITKEDVNNPNFEAEDIITTFELLNESYDPHLSIWTPDRAKHFFELENRFKFLKCQPEYNFDGRDIYMRFLVERI